MLWKIKKNNQKKILFTYGGQLPLNKILSNIVDSLYGLRAKLFLFSTDDQNRATQHYLCLHSQAELEICLKANQNIMSSLLYSVFSKPKKLNCPKGLLYKLEHYKAQDTMCKFYQYLGILNYSRFAPV